VALSVVSGLDIVISGIRVSRGTKREHHRAVVQSKDPNAL
jgi:hypothetical protein